MAIQNYEPTYDEFTACEDDQIMFTRRSCSQCGAFDAGIDGICNRCWDASFNAEDDE